MKIRLTYQPGSILSNFGRNKTEEIICDSYATSPKMIVFHRTGQDGVNHVFRAIKMDEIAQYEIF